MSNQKVDQKEKEVHEEERRREREKEEQEENEEEAKSESSLETKEKKTTLPENVELPIVELDKPVIATKEVEIDREISEIKEEVKIIIPLIELEKPSMEFRQIEFNSILPDIIPEEKGLKIPFIRLGRQKEVTCLITTLTKNCHRLE